MDRVVDEVSGSIWGPSGPSKKVTIGVIDEEEDNMSDHEEYAKRYDERKAQYLNKILGEFEAFTECEGESWGSDEEIMILDMLDAINNSVKAQLSSNDPEYKG